MTLENNDFSVKISKQAFRDVQEYSWMERAQKINKFINCP